MGNRILEIKEQVASRKGYRNDILGTSWEYAMMLTSRTKKQLELYEEVIKEYDLLLNEGKRKDFEKKCDHIWVNMDRTLMIWKCEKCGIISNV